MLRKKYRLITCKIYSVIKTVDKYAIFLNWFYLKKFHYSDLSQSHAPGRHIGEKTILNEMTTEMLFIHSRYISATILAWRHRPVRGTLCGTVFVDSSTRKETLIGVFCTFFLSSFLWVSMRCAFELVGSAQNALQIFQAHTSREVAQFVDVIH
jgi:hypothetical protein